MISDDNRENRRQFVRALEKLEDAARAVAARWDACADEIGDPGYPASFGHFDDVVADLAAWHEAVRDAEVAREKRPR